jgi:lipopolysaccharide transport system ATP-binding protein
MKSLAIRINNLGKSYRLAPEQIGKKWRKRRVLAEDIKALFSAKSKRDDFLLWALRDISFEIERGSVLGIMGPNGAGKSTLLKLLTKITFPTTGEIDLWGRTGALLEVGTGFHSELTGRENIFLSGSIMGMTRKEMLRKFDEIVDFSGVEAFLDIPVKRYSSGMEMRLAFSVAAHLDAKILFIDEVLAVGDSAFQQKCMRKMESISKEEGRTILFVSHNMKSISELCSQAIVLNQGRLVIPPTSVAQALLTYQSVISTSVGSNLADRKDRSGLGSVRCVGLTVSGEHGENPGEVISGNSMEIKIHLQSEGCDARQVQARLDFMQPDGQRLVSFQSPAIALNEQGGNNAVIGCRIQELPISPGVVQINLTIEENGRLQDKLAHAGYFVVSERPGMANEGEQAPYPTLQIPHSWGHFQHG